MVLASESTLYTWVVCDKHVRLFQNNWNPLDGIWMQGYVSLCCYGDINFSESMLMTHHDDVMKWKHFPRYWPFVQGIHRSPVNSRTKDSDAELWCFLLSSPGWWFQTPSHSLWRHCNAPSFPWTHTNRKNTSHPFSSNISAYRLPFIGNANIFSATVITCKPQHGWVIPWPKSVWWNHLSIHTLQWCV